MQKTNKKLDIEKSSKYDSIQAKIQQHRINMSIITLYSKILLHIFDYL